MEPRFGRLYASAVLRPLAEQLVAAIGVQPGDTTCDLVCDGGTLGVALGAATGVDGEVLLVDADAAMVAAAGADVSITGCAVTMLVRDADGTPVASASCDRVGSLCTAGFWDGSSLFDEAGRMQRTGGSAAIVTWDANRPPAHEAALSDALRDMAGVESDFLRCCVPAAPAAPEHWDATVLRDVVRFDGITHYWAAMVVERPAVATELAGTSVSVQRAVRDACERVLQPYSAADGTLRIPVTATMLRSTAR
jgi:SAM-dependent methyltransferase